MQGGGGLLVKVSDLRKITGRKGEIKLQSRENSWLITNFPTSGNKLYCKKSIVKKNWTVSVKPGSYQKLSHDRPFNNSTKHNQRGNKITHQKSAGFMLLFLFHYLSLRTFSRLITVISGRGEKVQHWQARQVCSYVLDKEQQDIEMYWKLPTAYGSSLNGMFFRLTCRNQKTMYFAEQKTISFSSAESLKDVLNNFSEDPGSQEIIYSSLTRKR